ncbi:putative orfan [Tupanvirus soda lake]|uniref:Orfan n=2 Tax=Tupanvirus TaxID=2094720 RepID=A0AC62AAT6_9VIRU|nr:putative orfan [Tupanvirus soda lake]QKU34897.1 putative orfan [Tupanvirus soda lake]
MKNIIIASNTMMKYILILSYHFEQFIEGIQQIGTTFKNVSTGNRLIITANIIPTIPTTSAPTSPILWIYN